MENLLNNLKNFDAYPKTMEDFRVRTYSGAAVSIISGIFIFWLFISEFMYYLTVEIQPELSVDTSRGEKLRINMDVVFPHLPCGYLSLDAMDISGDHQLDIDHNIFKKRLQADGTPLAIGATKEDISKATPSVDALPDNYCGSCYGAESYQGQCCNNCDQVQEAYRKKGWAFADGEGIEQCKREGYTQKLQEQAGEGCQVYGYLLVNKVAGNFHFAPGKSFQQHHMHVHDLQPYKNFKFNLTHTVNKLSFGREIPNMINPLDGVRKVADQEGAYMYQYFVKIVPTTYEPLSGNTISTNQFSVTEHWKNLGMDGNHGLPGVFIMYELSPIMVKYSEHHKSFAHFLTGVCAIIGGVFTVAGLVDSLIYTSMRSLKKKVELGKAS